MPELPPRSEQLALLRDYVADDVNYREVRKELRSLSSEQLSDPVEITQILGYGSVGQTEDFFVKPRGYRQLVRVPRLPRKVAENLIQEFGSLEGLLDATEEELDEVEGVGQARARAIHRRLERQRNLEPSSEVPMACMANRTWSCRASWSWCSGACWPSRATSRWPCQGAMRTRSLPTWRVAGRATPGPSSASTEPPKPPPTIRAPAAPAAFSRFTVASTSGTLAS